MDVKYYVHKYATTTAQYTYIHLYIYNIFYKECSALVSIYFRFINKNMFIVTMTFSVIKPLSDHGTTQHLNHIYLAIYQLINNIHTAIHFIFQIHNLLTRWHQELFSNFRNNLSICIVTVHRRTTGLIFLIKFIFLLFSRLSSLKVVKVR